MQYVTPRDRGVTGFSTETVSPAKTALWYLGFNPYHMTDMMWAIKKFKHYH